MPRFYFRLDECGQVTADPEGQMVADLPAARERAIHEARNIMSDEVLNGRLCLGCCMVIEDDDHQEVARVAFREALDVSGL